MQRRHRNKNGGKGERDKNEGFHAPLQTKMPIEEQIDKINEFADELRLLTARFEVFVDETFHNDGHPLWEVWQPLSTADGRMQRYVEAL